MSRSAEEISESRFNYDGCADTYGVKQLSDVFILQSHTAPGPIAPGAVTVNVDVAAQTRVLRRSSYCFQGFHDRFVLRSIDQAIAQTALSVRSVGIAETERKIESALVILREDVKVALRRAAVAGSHLVAHRAETQTDVIGADQLVI